MEGGGRRRKETRQEKEGEEAGEEEGLEEWKKEEGTGGSVARKSDKTRKMAGFVCCLVVDDERKKDCSVFTNTARVFRACALHASWWHPQDC